MYFLALCSFGVHAIYSCSNLDLDYIDFTRKEEEMLQQQQYVAGRG